VPYETRGIFVNREGRAQAFTSSLVPGVPVDDLIEHGRFPREPRLAPPGAGPRPAWWVLEALRGWTGGSTAPRRLGEHPHPAVSGLAGAGAHPEGLPRL
jgi:NADH dehydrogenase/NADH:ubiquinone oxidoreductase subunit G